VARDWRDRGALTLSYIIVVPVFLLGIMTVVQASVWYLARETALAAARHGADVARTSEPPPGDGAAAATSFAQTAAPGFLTSVSASSRGSTPETVRITVSGQVPTLVPWAVINVTEAVTAPVERFVAAGDGQVPMRADGDR
jgi:Flp pilus assembly protein TadG